jgi:hypothetical protein
MELVVLQVGGWAWGQHHHHHKKKSITKPKGNKAEQTSWQQHEAIHKGWQQSNEMN